MVFYDLIIKDTGWNDNVIQGSSGKHCSLSTVQDSLISTSDKSKNGFKRQGFEKSREN